MTSRTRRQLVTLLSAIVVAIIAYFNNRASAPRESPRVPPAIETSASAPRRGSQPEEKQNRPPRPTVQQGDRSRSVVMRVSDGDTLRVRIDGKERLVRLIGVDAPEIDGPYRKAEPGGNDARQFVRSLAESKAVRVETDPLNADDPHGRTLAYLYLPDGSLLNREIIRAGHARVYRKFKFRERESLLAAEKEAREAKRGIWRGRSYRLVAGG